MTDKTQIELAIVLPEVNDARDACVQRLRDLLLAKEGIAEAHCLEPDANRPQQLCIHFDPDKLSLGEVRQLAIRAGAQLHGRYGHLLIAIEPMHPSRAQTVEARVAQLAGVLEAAVSPGGLLRIEYDRDQTDEATLNTRTPRKISSSF